MHTYKGLQFKTRLEAKWAIFFDLAGWKWWANPAPVDDWLPDFKIEFECDHSECDKHTLMAEILPISSIEGLTGHPSLQHTYRCGKIADAVALFGTSPEVTLWEMCHGAGGGIFSVNYFVPNAAQLWQRAETQLNT